MALLGVTIRARLSVAQVSVTIFPTMPSEPELTQRSQHQILAELRNAAALLYPEESSARVIVDDAGLDARQIAFSSRAESNWHNIWLTAIRQNQLEALVAVLADRYPSNLPLQAAIANYQRFLAAGGQFNAQALLADSAPDDDAPAPGESPYQGMAYYDVADANRFFGREALTAELVDHLREQPLLTVVGASGSGKSSLVRAGVMPALQGKMPLVDGKPPPAGSARWAYHLITPTARPLESLAASLTRSSESVTATSTLIDDLGRDARSLHLYARRLVSGEQQLLLLVDQFEELFTLCKNETEQGAFVDNLLYAAQPDNDPKNSVVTLVLTLRADFYHHCARFPALRTALENQQKYIGAMTPDELRRAIEEPAKAGQWEFQAGLVEQLLQDVGQEPGALPLLSHALLETWQRRRGRTLTLAGYRAAGGVQGAIAKTADDVFHRFTDEQKTIARIIFLRLTELGEGVQDTRRHVRPAELKLTQASADVVQQVLKTLADARLVTTDDDEIQVAHEALIRNWKTLREWLDDDREGHRIQRRLTEGANQWVEFGKEPSLLYRGVLLQQVQERLQSTVDPPNQIEMEFLQASQAEIEAAAAEHERNRQRELENQRHRTRILRNAVIISSLLVLISLGLAEWGRRSSIKASNNATIATIALATLDASLNEVGKERDRANREAEIATIRASEARIAQANAEQQAAISFSRQIAIQSGNELRSNHYESAILLAIESGRSADTVEAFSTIRAAIANPWHSRLVFYGHTDLVTQVTWNQDESKILTSSRDGTVRIWDAVTGQELIRIDAHKDFVSQATWNRDESKILTRSYDDTVCIWDAVTGQELIRIDAHKDFVSQATWNQDESKILTSSADGTVRIWDAVTGQELIRIDDHKAFVSQATWNRDESKILTQNHNGTARIWDAVTGHELFKLAHHAGPMYQAIWNQDESKILTSSRDNFARIWDVATGQELLTLDGHNWVNQATWNQDESKILTTGNDKTARIWDATTGKELLTIEEIAEATWNQNGSKILTNSNGGTIRIWDVATGKELVRLEHTSWVDQAAWNQDESKILTNARDGLVHIWDADTGKELAKVEAHSGRITQATWNQDESRILTIIEDNTVRIWDTTPGVELLKFDTDYVFWNQDENKILATSRNGIVRVLDADTGQELVKLDSYTDSVTQVTWNQDGSKILTRNTDGISRIWNAVTGEELVKLDGHMGSDYQATWNKDGNRILGEMGGFARLWNTITGKVLLDVEGFPESSFEATWNQGGSRILTNSDGNTAHIWDAVTGQELVRFTGHTSLVKQAIWSQDESKIFTTSWDDTARIWDAEAGQELVRFEGPIGTS
jgi:WD40 repeat protein